MDWTTGDGRDSVNRTTDNELESDVESDVESDLERTIRYLRQWYRTVIVGGGLLIWTGTIMTMFEIWVWLIVVVGRIVLGQCFSSPREESFNRKLVAAIITTRMAGCRHHHDENGRGRDSSTSCTCIDAFVAELERVGNPQT